MILEKLLNNTTILVHICVAVYGFQVLYHSIFKKNLIRDFPGDAVVKNPPANAGDTGSIPGLGISHTPQSN